MTMVGLFLELWSGTVAVVGTGAAIRNRRPTRSQSDPSEWVRAMDGYLDQKLTEQHYARESHVCGPGCQRLSLTDDWRP